MHKSTHGSTAGISLSPLNQLARNRDPFVPALEKALKLALFHSWFQSVHLCKAWLIKIQRHLNKKPIAPPPAPRPRTLQQPRLSPPRQQLQCPHTHLLRADSPTFLNLQGSHQSPLAETLRAVKPAHGAPARWTLGSSAAAPHQQPHASPGTACGSRPQLHGGQRGADTPGALCPTQTALGLWIPPSGPSQKWGRAQRLQSPTPHGLTSQEVATGCGGGARTGRTCDGLGSQSTPQPPHPRDLAFCRGP